MYINKAMVYGNLTRDPELKTLPSGTAIASFALATNRVYTKDGERKEDTEFHNIIVFGRQAETSAQYLKKGSSAYVEGRLQTRSWEKDGNKQYRTEVVAERVQFGARGGNDQVQPPKEEKTAEPAKIPNTGVDYPEEEVNPQDIPF